MFYRLIFNYPEPLVQKLFCRAFDYVNIRRRCLQLFPYFVPNFFFQQHERVSLPVSEFLTRTHRVKSQTLKTRKLCEQIKGVRYGTFILNTDRRPPTKKKSCTANHSLSVLTATQKAFIHGTARHGSPSTETFLSCLHDFFRPCGRNFPRVLIPLLPFL